jgi:hypothetical protein
MRAERRRPVDRLKYAAELAANPALRAKLCVLPTMSRGQIRKASKVLLKA